MIEVPGLLIAFILVFLAGGGIGAALCWKFVRSVLRAANITTDFRGL